MVEVEFWFLTQMFYFCLKNYILKKLLVQNFQKSVQVIYNLVKSISICDQFPKMQKTSHSALQNLHMNPE